MQWRVADLLPSPDTRDPLTLQTFLRDIAAPFLCYYATAVLVLTPNTILIRRFTLPLSLWTFFQGATRLDIVKAQNNYERLVFLNHGLVIIHIVLAMRLITWSFQTQPLSRVTTLQAVTPQFYRAKPGPWRPKQVLVDAFELCCNLRGCGWNWSQHLQIPPETRPTSSTAAFVVVTWMSLLIHVIMFDVYQYSIQWFGPTTIGSATGGSIFDTALPPMLRYTRSTLITFLSGMAVYSAIQTGYYIPTLFGVLVFKQDISLWPPAFNAPWFSTSLTELWAKRWHQLFREVFIAVGGKPSFALFGRAGSVLGAFMASGLLHIIGLWGMGRGTDFLRIGGFFILNGLGIIMERTWRKMTGFRVGGWMGWVWTLVWIIGWGHILVEPWARRGLIGSAFFPQSLRPTTYLFGPLY